MSNHILQVIRSDKVFVIHQYTFGVFEAGLARPISELSTYLRCTRLPHSFDLQPIYTTDKFVIKSSRVKDAKLSDILGV